MKIWGRINSTNVRKALWAAEELGLDYERVDAGGAFGIVDTPEYRAMNPNGLVPCLEDGDLVLWESNVIVRYLARVHGQAPFTPQDARGWALAEKWMDWASISFAGPYRDMYWNMVRATPETRDTAAIARGIEGCGRLLAMADAQLSRTPWLCGDEFSVADIPLGVICYAWYTLDIERPDLPALAAWYARLTERPAYRRAVMTLLT